MPRRMPDFSRLTCLGLFDVGSFYTPDALHLDLVSSSKVPSDFAK